MLDGLAFRYFWATEELREGDMDFRPAADCMSTSELQVHVLHLAVMILQTIKDAPERERYEIESTSSVRALTLTKLEEAREFLVTLEDDQIAEHRVLKRDGSCYPVWNIMNGPLADALTHVGQLNSWRRLNGNPPLRANVFTGMPPVKGVDS